MKNTIKVIFTLAKMQLSKSMMYQYSFWGAFLCGAVTFFIQLLVFKVIAQDGYIGDWSIYHLTVFVGAFMAFDGLHMTTYFFGLIGIPYQVRTGTLDLIIIKPVHTLFYIAFSCLSLGCLLQFIVGLIIAGYGAMKLNTLHLQNILQFILVFILMDILMFSLMLSVRCLSFWMTKIDSICSVENTLVEFSFRLPSPAIRGNWRILLYAVIPFGLMANMPAEALLGVFGIKKWCLCFGVTSFFFMVALILWKFGRNRYDSASS